MTQTSVVTGGAGFIGSNLVHALLPAAIGSGCSTISPRAAGSTSTTWGRMSS